jgi:hypothetical protein
MDGSPFPIAKALALAACLAVVHCALAFFLLFASVGGLFPPAMLGFHVLAFPLIATVPDLFSRPHHLAWILNSLAYGFVAAWAWCFARWSRRTKGASPWDAGLGTAFVTYALIALPLGELCQSVTGPEAAESEARAIRRAEVAEADAVRFRTQAAADARAAADSSILPHIREFRARYAREAESKAGEAEGRARSFRAEAAHYARGKLRPGTRYPALILLAFGVSLGWIARRRRRRLRIELADDLA